MRAMPTQSVAKPKRRSTRRWSWRRTTSRCGAAYKFFFYANRLDQALPHAEACLAMAGDALALPRNWCVVTSDSARFAGFDRPQRIYLQSLIAIGYCRARLGDTESGEALLRQAARLDPQDRMGAGRLADVVARGGIDDEE